MVCRLRFYPNKSKKNYVNDLNHNKSTCKYWFLVFGVGLFTKQTDADAAAEHRDGVHVFRSHAWARLPILGFWAHGSPRELLIWVARAKPSTRSYLMSEASGRRRGGLVIRKMILHKRHHKSTDTDEDTEGPIARTCILARVTSATHPQCATAPVKPKRDVDTNSTAMAESKLGAAKPAGKRDDIKRGAASVPVKSAGPVKAEPITQVKVSLYADMEDESDDDNIPSDSSVEVPLAKSLAALGANSRAKSVVLEVSYLEDEEDATMPAAPVPVSQEDAAMPAAPVPVSPTVSYISSEPSLLSTSVAPSNFSSMSAAMCAPPHLPAHLPLAAGPFASPFASAPLAANAPFPSAWVRPLPAMFAVEALDSSSGNVLFNRRTRILYDSPKLAMKEKKPGDPMEVVVPAQVEHWVNGHR
ncbi:hypothetical protein C8R45DRAFT_933123 [Mycena sanguinolenta]|nr:hypothetical protein C8R45DRAFT_933123 [Mycena sanguinolenta]